MTRPELTTAMLTPLNRRSVLHSVKKEIKGLTKSVFVLADDMDLKADIVVSATHLSRIRQTKDHRKHHAD